MPELVVERRRCKIAGDPIRRTPSLNQDDAAQHKDLAQALQHYGVTLPELDRSVEPMLLRALSGRPMVMARVGCVPAGGDRPLCSPLSGEVWGSDVKCWPLCHLEGSPSAFLIRRSSSG